VFYAVLATISTATPTSTTTADATDFGDAPVTGRLRRRYSYRRVECQHVMATVCGRSCDDNHRWPLRQCRRRHVSRLDRVDDNTINTPVRVVRKSVKIAHATGTLAETYPKTGSSKQTTENGFKTQTKKKKKRNQNHLKCTYSRLNTLCV